MEKKLYLRIQALILALFIVLTTCVIVPQQLHADEAEPVVDGEVDVLPPEETVADNNSTEETADADGIPPEETEEADSLSAGETEEPAAEPTEETDIGSTESPSDQELDLPDEANETAETEDADASLGDGEESATEQTAEDAVVDQADDQAADDAASTDEDGTNTRAGYSPASDFDFDPATRTITKYIGTSTVVSIPPSINGVSVQCIGDQAFLNKGLTSVTIPTSVTEIKSFAFNENLLTGITIPSTVTMLGDWAFSSNQIESVEIPSSITTIGWGVFMRTALRVLRSRTVLQQLNTVRLLITTSPASRSRQCHGNRK